MRSLDVAAAVLVIGTLLSLWRQPAWWVRAWDFPRLQVLVLGLAVMLARCLLEVPRRAPETVIFVLLALCLAFQVWRIFPYTPLAATRSLAVTTPRAGDQVSLMVANVYMENRHSEALVELVRERQPDLFFAVETDDRWAGELAVLEDLYAYRVTEPLENTYGLVLYSRLELVDAQIRYLVDGEVPSVHALVRLGGGRLVRIHLLHPKPPVPTESLESTDRDAEILIVGREVRAHGQPAIVAGDLNDVAWSRTTRLFQRVSGMLDPRIGRGLYSTFNARIPFLRWPLDHVFHTGHFKLVTIERMPDVGSDHFPIFAHLCLEPGARQEQQAPEIEPGDRTEAIETIEEAGLDPAQSPIIPAGDQEEPWDLEERRTAAAYARRPDSAGDAKSIPMSMPMSGRRRPPP